MGFLKSVFKLEKEIVIAAPVKGKLVEIDKVNDVTFSEETLGKGVAIEPSEGMIYAPADGTVSSIISTGHAAAITTKDGVEVLIHIGLDTIALNGKYFKIHVQDGQTVNKGDLLVEVDLEKTKKEGYDMIVPVVILNTEEYAEVKAEAGRTVDHGEAIIKIKK
jgi:PTS system, glucose subfamily, IIA component